MATTTWLDTLLGKLIRRAGVDLPTQRALNFSTSFAVTNNDGAGSTDVDITVAPVSILWTTTKTDTYSAVAADRGIPTDTRAKSFGVFLPPAPTDGEDHVITDATGFWDTNPLMIFGNGHTILGGSSYIATGRWNTLWFSYIASQGIWVLL